MTRHVLSLFLVFSTDLAAGSPITNLVLNPREVVTVPVATDRLSTIYFPSPLSHLEAAYVSTEAGPPARFQLSFRPGNSFFSVRALATNVAATINVIWRTNVYVFELVSSSQPTLSISLVEPAKHDIRAGSIAPSPHRLLGLLDTAKAFPLLRRQQPSFVADVQYAPRHERYDFGNYELWLEEVFRFQTENALIFKVVLINKTTTALRYLPQSFRVRVGERFFPAAIAEGDGVLPGLSRVPLHFAVTTAPDGSRPALSVANDFLVLVTVPHSPHSTAQPSTSPRP